MNIDAAPAHPPSSTGGARTLLHAAILGTAIAVMPSIPAPQRFWLPKLVVLAVVAAFGVWRAAAQRTESSLRLDTVTAAMLAFVSAALVSWVLHGTDGAAAVATLSQYAPALVFFIVIRSTIARGE